MSEQSFLSSGDHVGINTVNESPEDTMKRNIFSQIQTKSEQSKILTNDVLFEVRKVIKEIDLKPYAHDIGKVMVFDIRGDGNDFETYLMGRDDFHEMFEITRYNYVEMKDSFLAGINEDLDVAHDEILREMNQKFLVYSGVLPSSCVMEKFYIWSE
jgi:hypothetical protein